MISLVCMCCKTLSLMTTDTIPLTVRSCLVLSTCCALQIPTATSLLGSISCTQICWCGTWWSGGCRQAVLWMVQHTQQSAPALCICSSRWESLQMTHCRHLGHQAAAAAAVGVTASRGVDNLQIGVGVVLDCCWGKGGVAAAAIAAAFGGRGRGRPQCECAYMFALWWGSL
jgi:hypothetical protein